MPDNLTNFDLDSLSINPDEVRQQNVDTNTALRDVAKNREAQYTGILDAAVNLDEITRSEAVENEQRNVNAAQQLETVYSEAETMLGEMNQRTKVIHGRLNNLSAEILELNNARDSGELGLIERFTTAREINKLERQYDRLRNASQNMVEQKDRYMHGVQLTTDRVNNQTAISNQANRNIQNFERSIALENTLSRIQIALEGDEQVINAIERRRQTDPNTLAQEERDGMELFESMYLMQNGSLEGYTKEQARNMQGIYSEFEQEDRTAMQWANFEYMRAKNAGVTLTPEDLIGMAMRNSDLNAVETLSKMYSDPTLFESIQDGKQGIVASEFARLENQLLSDPNRENPELTDGEVQQLSRQANESLRNMTGRQILGSIQSSVQRDVQEFTNQTGTQIYADASEDPASLVPEHFPQVREYLASEKGKLHLSKPDVRDNQGKLSTIDSLVQGMREQRIPDSQIFNGLAEFTNNAAKANYLNRTDSGQGQGQGQGQHARTMIELEKFGMDFSQDLVAVPYPSDRVARAPRGSQASFKLGNASDLQKSVEALGLFRQRREQQLQRRQSQALQHAPGGRSVEIGEAMRRMRENQEGNQ